MMQGAIPLPSSVRQEEDYRVLLGWFVHSLPLCALCSLLPRQPQLLTALTGKHPLAKSRLVCAYDLLQGRVSEYCS